MTTFRDTIGVCLHTQYSDTKYRDHKATLAALEWLGVQHVRDLAPKDLPNRPPYGLYHAKKFLWSLICMPYGGFDAGEVFGRIQKHFPPELITQFEGPNEPDNQPISFAGCTDQRRKSYFALQTYMADLAWAKSAHPIFSKIPLAGVCVDPYLRWPAFPADLANDHVYPRNGSVWKPAYTRPTVVTEFGHNAGPVDGFAGIVTDPRKHASLLLTGLINAFPTRVYIYELWDEKAERTYGNQWGLFSFDGTPRLAATALRNFMSIVGDGVRDRHIDGRLTLKRSDGKKRIIIPGGGARTVTLPAISPNVTLYNPLDSDQPVKAWTNVRSIPLPATSEPMIVGTR